VKKDTKEAFVESKKVIMYFYYSTDMIVALLMVAWSFAITS
jgi:hypothetical protein